METSDERQKRIAAERHRCDNSAKNQAWAALKAGKRYASCRFENYDCQHPGQQNAIDALREYASYFLGNEGGGVLICGSAGSGKDHLLFALAHEVIRQHCKAREIPNGYFNSYDIAPTIRIGWIDGTKFFSDLRAGMDDERFNEGDYLESLIDADVLIFSDPLPPKGTLTDYQASMLFRVVDGRYRDQRPTWTTMNVLTPAEAAERLTPQIIDRLRHGALCIQTTWPSYRKAETNVLTK
jgi:DNA replication protein DnaC